MNAISSTLLIALIGALAFPAAAQQLSPEEVKQYLSGAGMGYAKAAELNHFPGPMHVLELADKLQLSAEQRAATERLMQAHKEEARALGGKLVVAEQALEELFRSGAVSDAQLAKAVGEAARLQGEYRLSHLETHRRMRALLNEEQVRRYDTLLTIGWRAVERFRQLKLEADSTPPLAVVFVCQPGTLTSFLRAAWARSAYHFERDTPLATQGLVC